MNKTAFQLLLHYKFLLSLSEKVTFEVKNYFVEYIKCNLAFKRNSKKYKVISF